MELKGICDLRVWSTDPDEAKDLDDWGCLAENKVVLMDIEFVGLPIVDIVR